MVCRRLLKYRYGVSKFEMVLVIPSVGEDLFEDSLYNIPYTCKKNDDLLINHHFSYNLFEKQIRTFLLYICIYK
jgi:hypothetical protein